MKDGRRFERPPDPHEPPAAPAGKINLPDPDSRNVKRPRGWCRATTPRRSAREPDRDRRRGDDRLTGLRAPRTDDHGRRAMLDALVSGTTDPLVLAELAKGRLREKLPALREALEGRFEA